MEERRRAPRSRSYKSGQINAEGYPSIDCIIRNLTDGGACIEVDSKLVRTDQFRLVIHPEYLNRLCDVVWREPKRIGVKFVASQA